MRLFPTLLFLALWAPIAALAGDHGPRAGHERPGIITVQADAWVEAVPDTLELTIIVKETRKNLAQASAAADALTREVTKIAEGHKIGKNDIDTSRMSSWPEYQWRKEERVYLGETVQREINLTVRELDDYSALMGALSRLALHRVQPPRLVHSSLEDLKMQALKKALAKGREKAALIAAEIGMTLGNVRSVTEQGGGGSPRPMMMMAEARADSGGDPEFNFSSQRISAEVQMQFAIAR